jgi:hypothetical protein
LITICTLELLVENQKQDFRKESTKKEVGDNHLQIIEVCQEEI